MEKIIMKTPIATATLPRLLAATILGALAVGCAAAGTTGDDHDVPRAVVKFGDLNLSARDGSTVLYGRITAAAYKVCRSFDVDRYGQLDLTALIACVHSTVRNAVVKVGSPALSAIYNSRYGDALPITVASASSR
jgi:UrcA family protein